LKTALVVYTVGCTENAALTCQARPQDGEVFGEFPPRMEMLDHSKFPVIVPSSTPGYNSHYTSNYLQEYKQQAKGTKVNSFIDKISDIRLQSYARILVDYLSDALKENPKRGFGNRTSLWGLQTIPTGMKNVIRISKDTDYDVFAIYFIPFFMTSSSRQIIISINPENKFLEKFDSFGSSVVRQSDKEYEEKFVKQAIQSNVWGVIKPEKNFDFPLVGHFVSTLVPLGHIKSTKKDDEEFVSYFKESTKWLKLE